MIQKAQPETLLKPPCSRGKVSRASSGFTVMEILVVIAVIGILGTITIGIFNSLRPKMALTNASAEVSSIFQKARMAAIRQNRIVEIIIDNELGGETEDYNPAGIKNEWLVLNAIDAYGVRTEISSYQMFRGFPAIHIWGPAEGVIQGASSSTFAGLAYKNDGSVVSTGALRLSYFKGEGAIRNTLEIAVPSLSGLPVVRKYLETEDRPSSASSQEFFEKSVASSAGRRTLWVWY